MFLLRSVKVSVSGWLPVGTQVGIVSGQCTHQSRHGGDVSPRFLEHIGIFWEDTELVM